MTPNQENILRIVDVFQCMRGNVIFFDTQRKQQPHPTFEKAFEVNLRELNSLLNMLFNFKETIIKEEYDALLAENVQFQEFDKIFLQENVEVTAPKKSSIILLGD